MRRLIMIAAGLLLLLPLQALAGGSFVEQFNIPPDATYVGAETCLDCHDDVGAFYAHSPHSPTLGLPVPGTAAFSCEGCHGPGSLHVAQDGAGFIVGPDLMATLNNDQRAGMCLQCHTSYRMTWNDSPHAGSDISCNDCHADQVHFGGQAVPAGDFRNQAEFCIQCHTNQVTDFRMPFRHRVLEGQLTCKDCHNPHAGFDSAGWNGINDTCTSCHTEMSGPFVFEHEAVADESCVVCHKPHGSVNDKLLTQDGNTLCLQCHYGSEFNIDGGFTIGDHGHDGLLNSEARCYDCHHAIHGSNVSSTLRN